MSIRVDPDWWKTLFDEVYLLTDARSVCDHRITRREVDVICSLLPIKGSHKILDLCGGHGRHSIELSSRGFTACTLFDYSRTLIEIARDKARKDDVAVNFMCGDAREIDMPADTYDHVIIMGNSMGYVQKKGADAKILAEVYRVLQSGRAGYWWMSPTARRSDHALSPTPGMRLMRKSLSAGSGNFRGNSSAPAKSS